MINLKRNITYAYSSGMKYKKKMVRVFLKVDVYGPKFRPHTSTFQMPFCFEIPTKSL